MKQDADLLRSLDDSWKRFSSIWKKAHAKTAEPSIHDFRVAARRLIARIDLADAVLQNETARQARKRVKKALKRMGSLRDRHVQLETLDSVSPSAAAKDFRRHLKAGVAEMVSEVEDCLQEENRLRLKERIVDLKAELKRAIGKLDDSALRQPIERSIAKRFDEYMQTRRKFESGDEAMLHKMRIALKKVRYTVETGQEFVGGWTAEALRKMQASQRLLGEAHDIEVLKSELENWAAKENRRSEVASIFKGLDRRRKSLIVRIAKSSRALDHVAPKESIRPIHETARAASPRPRSTHPRKTDVARKTVVAEVVPLAATSGVSA